MIENRFPAYVKECVENLDLLFGEHSFLIDFFNTEENIVSLKNIAENILEHPNHHSHKAAYNVLVILSEIPYSQLGSWALGVAKTAASSAYKDIAEAGIRCFENWECKEALPELESLELSDPWLKSYADDVCQYLRTI